ncbi:MAG: hypothetical protein ACREOF_06210 [Gemmatimonadales bacterium]
MSVFATLVGVLALFISLMVLLSAKTIMQEIAAALGLLITVVSFSAAGIAAKLDAIHRALTARPPTAPVTVSPPAPAILAEPRRPSALPDDADPPPKEWPLSVVIIGMLVFLVAVLGLLYWAGVLARR